MPEDFQDLYEGIIRDLYERASEQGPRPKDRNYLMSPDGKFLGKLTANRFDVEGIFNKYGPYGSKYSSDSIFNKYGPYGSMYSNTSPWNPYAGAAPFVYLNNQLAGVLSKNRYAGPNVIDPDELLETIRSEPQYRY